MNEDIFICDRCKKEFTLAELDWVRSNDGVNSLVCGNCEQEVFE